MINTRGIAKQKLETVGTLKQINEWSEAILLSKDNTLIHNRFRNSTSEKRGGTNMYLDNNIVIDFRLPLSLQNDIKELDKDFSSGNDLHFALVLEIFEATAKQSYINGNITDEQLNLLFRRYGLR
jgi:hypothetical protein